MLQIPSKNSIRRMVTEGRQHGLIMQIGTSMRHGRHQQRLHRDWKLWPIDGDKLRVTSTTPKVKLINWPTDVIYSAMFEGDMTRLLPKITYFIVHLFMFFDFFGVFQIFWKDSKRIKLLYSYRLGGDECQGENKQVPSSRTYLCSMQGHMCRIWHSRESFLLVKMGNQDAKDM